MKDKKDRIIKLDGKKINLSELSDEELREVLKKITEKIRSKNKDLKNNIKSIIKEEDLIL